VISPAGPGRRLASFRAQYLQSSSEGVGVEGREGLEGVQYLEISCVHGGRREGSWVSGSNSGIDRTELLSDSKGRFGAERKEGSESSWAPALISRSDRARSSFLRSSVIVS
jgi:hypothetical protein